MYSEDEIREALAVLLRTYRTVGLEPRHRRGLEVAMGTLHSVLGEKNPFLSLEKTLRDCRTLLAPLDETPVGA